MENRRIIVGSISYAIKAKRLLAKKGILAGIVKETDHTEGCSYGLSFAEKDAYRVYTVLADAGIRIKTREDRP